jgi:hypothetical protein
MSQLVGIPVMGALLPYIASQSLSTWPALGLCRPETSCKTSAGELGLDREPWRLG